jgi:hypothetical protein
MMIVLHGQATASPLPAALEKRELELTGPWEVKTWKIVSYIA